MTWAGVSARRSSTRIDARGDMLAAQRSHRRGVTRQPEQVVALVEREPQAAGDRGEHLLRRLRTATLLEPAVVVHRHVAQRGDLFAAQSGGAPPRAAAKADVFGLQHLAPTTEEVGQLRSVHASSLRECGAAEQGTGSPCLAERSGSGGDLHADHLLRHVPDAARGIRVLKTRVQTLLSRKPAQVLEAHRCRRVDHRERPGSSPHRRPRAPPTRECRRGCRDATGRG